MTRALRRAEEPAADPARRLEAIWEAPRGIVFEFATVDHKKIGARYIATAFVFFVLAGLAALIMRVQLARPELSIVTPEVFNQLFTLHGTTMIFFFATPMLSGFGNYFLPLMLGARDMAFPRLNAFGYWVFLFSGLFMYSSMLFAAVPDGGWFAYAPLSGRSYSPAMNIDFWALALIFLSVSSTAGATNFIVTILKLRAPGMTLNRMPLFAWAVLVTSFALLFALPPLTTANIFLELDRGIGTTFYEQSAGGSPLLWQHLFWVFGHPDVYIIFLPAVGMVSTVIPVFARRPIVGYSLVALATALTGALGFGVWVHHMFATGLPVSSLGLFGAASMVITIPSAVQIFAWIATIWGGPEIVWRTPLLFMLGFIVTFVVGGLSGVMFAVVPFDWQATDTYFVVAHFHYVLLGGAVFPIFGAFYYWLPKMTGRMLDERLGQINFWTFFIGFNLTFFPMHIAGLIGMPRRIYTYPGGLGWDGYNLVSTAGAAVLTVSILVFVWNVWRSGRRGAPAGDDPWGANTLEWATSSPPPAYNFLATPAVIGPDPLWTEGVAVRREIEARDGLLATPHREEREALATSTLDAEVEARLTMPGDSLWPLGLAFGLLLLTYGLLPQLLIPRVLWVSAGLGLAVFSLLGWVRPTGAEVRDEQGAQNEAVW